MNAMNIEGFIKTSISGFGLNTDVKKIEFPDRFPDRRGIKTWHAIMDILANNL